MTDTPPQQPNRPEGLRELLHRFMYTFAPEGTVTPERFETLDLVQTEAAIRSRIEQAIPEKENPGDYEDWGGEDLDFYQAEARDAAIEEFKSNIQRELGI